MTGFGRLLRPALRPALRLVLVVLVLALPPAAGTVAGGALAGAWERPAAAPDAGVVARPDGVDPPAADAEFTYLLTHPDGSPVRWDPCRAIRVVVRPDGGPSDGSALVAEALADLAAATGLVVEVVGPTEEPPRQDRPAHQPQRYGDGWAPVLVAWSDEREYPPLAGDRVGVATPVAVDPAGRPPARYVSGSVVLDGEWFAATTAPTAGPGGREQALAVLKHEFGHLVGLDHVTDPGHLMSPVYRSLPDWSAGDRAGLALMGSGPCLDDHSP